MKFGYVLPGGSAHEQLEAAVVADQSGWDGVFVWEAAYGVDAWTLLAAMAMRTDRVRLGTMLTPLPWRRPWKVASQVATLDQISNGRAILSVGLGAVDDSLGDAGEEVERIPRAEMLDEGIDLVRGLWQGNLIYNGSHYNVDFRARAAISDTIQPVQARIPIWIVGAWRRPKSLRRVLKGDGILPTVIENSPGQEFTPEVVGGVAGWLKDNGAPEGFDIIVEGSTPADDAAQARDKVAPLAEAGATWWIEADWMVAPDQRESSVRARLKAGPPRV